MNHLKQKLFYVDSPNINTDISTEQKRELVKSIVSKNTEQTPILENTEDQKKWIEDNKEQLLEDYRNTNGNKFDPDRVREMLIPIGYNKHNLSTYYAAGRYLSEFIKQRMFETLANSNNKTVTILTGTPGSGKSFATKNRKAEFDKRGVLFDSAFHSIEELQEVVNAARNAGVKDENIQVVAVYNDLATTFKNSVTRGKNQNGEDYGRFLPIKYFIESFTKNQGKISALLDNNPNIQVVTIDNSNNQGKEVSNDEARQWDYSVNEEQIESLIKLIINDNEIQESKRKELIERVFNEGISFQDIQRLAEVSEENRKDGTRRIRQLFHPEIRNTFGNQLGIESQEEALKEIEERHQRIMEQKQKSKNNK